MYFLPQLRPLQPYTLNGDTAPAFWALGLLWLPMATGVQTGNRLTFIEQHMVAGNGPPAHYHPYDEGFYVLEGEITFNVGGATHRAGPGTAIHIPRLVQHSFTVEAPSRVLNFYPASGFELILFGMGQPATERRVPTKPECPPPPPEHLATLFRLFGHVNAGTPSHPPVPADFVTHPVSWSPSAPRLTTAAPLPTYAALGSQWTLLLGSEHTAGSYALFERLVLAAAAAAPTWERHAEAEALYVLAGTLRVELNGQVSEAPAGTFIFIPAGTVHALTAPAGPARLLNLYLPGGFERGITDFSPPLDEHGQPTGAAREADRHLYFEQIATHRFPAPPLS